MTRRARELLTLGEPERATYVLEEALGLWRGRPLPELQSWDPGRIETGRLEELRLDAEELHLDAALAAGHQRAVLATARARVEQAPVREHRWAQLALAQYRVGGQAEALRTLNEARTVLGRELGLSPGPELVALEAAILRQDPSLAPRVAIGEPSGACPWPGLVSYDVADAELFVGRAAEIAACLHRFAATNVLAVVGPSGNGKSSLVRAGIAATLEREGRRVLVVVPAGPRPADALRNLPPTGSPVLIVDQCEQAVTQAEAHHQREFFDALVAWSERAPLVVALRADRMGEVSAHEAFARVVERGLLLLGPMAEQQLRAAIEEPARLAGLLLEPGLVDLVVRDVLDEPGALPLMSHALRQTWLSREGPTLTVQAYRDSGGIRGAVAQTAEAVYDDVGVEDQPRLRDLLLRLVAPSVTGEPVRSRVSRDALVPDIAHERLVERLVRARLVTTDEGVVEIAHEALARAWPRLQDWLEEDEAGLRVLRHLTNAATGWDALGRPDSELYRGVRLAQALEWRDRTGPELTDVEAEFLRRSSEQEASAVERAEQQVRRERRTVRRLRRLVAVATVLSVATAGVSLVALDQRERADDSARVADARRLAARALVVEPYDLALLLAVESVRRWDSEETRGNLLATIERNPLIAGVLRTEGRAMEVQVSPSGDRAVAVDHLGAIALHDLETGGLLATRREARVVFRSPVFHPDGSTIAVSRMPTSCWFGVGCGEGGVELLDAGDLEPIDARFEFGDVPASLAFSRDGARLAGIAPLSFAEPVDNVAIWDTRRPGRPVERLTVANRGGELRVTPDHLSRSWIGFSGDEAHVLASGAGPVETIEVGSGRTVASLPSGGALALSADGLTIAVAAGDTRIALHDAATGERLHLLDGHEGLVTAAAFSRDGRLLATAGNDESILVWNVSSGERVHALRGHSGSVNGVAFGPAGDRLYSAGADRTVVIWDLERQHGLARRAGEPVVSSTGEGVVIPSPTGDSIALLGERAYLVDLERGTASPLALDDSLEAAWGAFSPDGRRFATVSYEGRTRMWDVGQPEPSASAPGRGTGNFGALAFSSDGESVVVADEDGTITELDSRTLEPTGRSLTVGLTPVGVRATVGGVVAITGASLEDPSLGTPIVFADMDDGETLRQVTLEQPLVRANFSGDGTRYAAGGADGRLRVVDLSTGEVSGPDAPTHAGPIAWVTFSPDTRTLVSIGFDGQVVLSDATTGAPRARLQPGPTNVRASATCGVDGHTLLLAYQDGSAITYETDSDAWIDHACRVAGRDLTADEWRDIVGSRRQRPTCSG